MPGDQQRDAPLQFLRWEHFFFGNSVDLVWAPRLEILISREGQKDRGRCPHSAVDYHLIGKNYTQLNGGDFRVRVPLTRG